MKIIEGAWEMYRNTVVPKEASEIQVRETRLAFYAGVHTLQTLLEEAGKQPENIYPLFLDQFEQEMHEFKTEVEFGAFMERMMRKEDA